MDMMLGSQLVFYASVFQEVTHFQIVSLLMAQDLTEALERFHWESFEVWLDTNGDRLTWCFLQLVKATTLVDREGVESLNSSTSLLHLPMERKISFLNKIERHLGADMSPSKVKMKL